MGIFITDNDSFDITFFCGELNGEMSCVGSEIEAKEKFTNNAFEKHIVSFKKMNYGMLKKVQAACMQDSDGKFVFNPMKFRSERFAQSIKKWSFKDSSGNPVPITPQALDNLSSSIAFYLMDEFDKKV